MTYLPFRLVEYLGRDSNQAHQVGASSSPAFESFLLHDSKNELYLKAVDDNLL